MAKVKAVCISREKGTRKTVVPEITIEENYGISGDAHADSAWHRQVSLLADESVDKMREAIRQSYMENRRQLNKSTAQKKLLDGLVKGLGLRDGALASSVAHDSHNLVVAGMDERSMLTAAARVRELGGGLVAALGEKVLAELPLPLAGLMSDQDLPQVLAALEELRAASDVICSHPEPFMPLSFVCLPVIPHLKLTDRGLVDVDAFAPVELFPA
jgi:adenine deaminase